MVARQPLSAVDTDYGWNEAFGVLEHDPSPGRAEGQASQPRNASTPAPKPKIRLQLVNAAAVALREFGQAWDFFPEDHATELLRVTVGPKVVKQAAYVASLLDELDVPPLQRNRSVAVLFLGIMGSVPTAGRGIAILIRTLLYRGSASAAAAHAAGSLRGLMLPVDAVRGLLAAVLVLLRHAECGVEVTPVHDAIEAELQRVAMLPRGGLDAAHEAAQAAAAGPGGMQLTAEQLAASRPTLFGPDGKPLVARLQAFAGAAKTTMLRAIVRNFPEYDFLYLVYNKDAQLAGQAAMQADLVRDRAAGIRRVHNFEVRTTHSLAYHRYDVSARFAGRKISELTSGGVRDFLVRRWGPRDDKHVRGSLVAAVRKTLARYMTSDEPRVSERHLPTERKQVETMAAHMSELLWRIDGVIPKAMAGTPHPRYSMQLFVDAAAALWDHLFEPGCRLSLPHNAYLKAFALSDVVLASSSSRPLVVLVDEAQDINAVTKQILIDKQELPVVLVGDKHQQIYSFNYACGLMAGRTPLSRDGGEMSLRQTFRFGHEIAAAANAILKAGLQEPRYIVGQPRDTQAGAGHPGVVYALLPASADLDSVRPEQLLPPAPPPGGGGAAAAPPPYRGMRYLQCPLRRPAPDAAFPAGFPVLPISGVALLPPDFRLPPCAGRHPAAPLPLLCYVARTNAALVRAGLELVAAGRSVCASFGGDHWNGLIRKLRDVVAFLGGKRNWWRDHELYGLASEEELQQLVEFEAAGDLATAYHLAKQYSLEQVEALGKQLKQRRQDAEYYLATTHKMKGDEARVVQLADDFLAELAPGNSDGRARLRELRSSPCLVDEINCVYVAATRARAVLLLNRDLSRLLLGLHRRHVELVLPEQEPESGAAAPATTAATAAPGRAPPAKPSPAGPMDLVYASDSDSDSDGEGEGEQEVARAAAEAAACPATPAKRRAGGSGSAGGGGMGGVATFCTPPQKRTKVVCVLDEDGEVWEEHEEEDGGKTQCLFGGSSQAPGAIGQPAAPRTWCCMCGMRPVEQTQQALPRVTWRGRPVCGACGRGGLFGQVIELAEARLARRQLAEQQQQQQLKVKQPHVKQEQEV